VREEVAIEVATEEEEEETMRTKKELRDRKAKAREEVAIEEATEEEVVVEATEVVMMRTELKVKERPHKKEKKAATEVTEEAVEAIEVVEAELTTGLKQKEVM
jgi:hypothetical protein